MLVRYVDGTEAIRAPTGWRGMRSEGVDHVDLQVAEGLTYRIQGRSIYWLYQQADGRWVAGGGIVGSNEPIVEAVADTTRFEIRCLEFMPDLERTQVKLGWWD